MSYNLSHQGRLELPYDPAIPLLGLYPKETKILTPKDICNPVFTAAQFTKVKTWKKPKWPLTDEGIKKTWYYYTMEYYSALKQKEILLFAAAQMNLEGFMLSEVDQTEKHKYTICSHYMQNLKNKQISNSQIQRRDWWPPETVEGRVKDGQKVQTSSYK